MLDYTLYVYKSDKRCKLGEKLFKKEDFTNVSGTWMQEHMSWLRSTTFKPADGWRMEFCDTYVTRVNAMTGEQFQERHDVPYFASPRSETYWNS